MLLLSLTTLAVVEGQIDTGFSLGVITRVEENGNSTVLAEMGKLGLPLPIRGKVNVGLGEPLCND